jgi:hypothetical protein
MVLGAFLGSFLGSIVLVAEKIIANIINGSRNNRSILFDTESYFRDFYSISNVNKLQLIEFMKSIDQGKSFVTYFRELQKQSLNINHIGQIALRNDIRVVNGLIDHIGSALDQIDNLNERIIHLHYDGRINETQYIQMANQLILPHIKLLLKTIEDFQEKFYKVLATIKVILEEDFTLFWVLSRLRVQKNFNRFKNKKINCEYLNLKATFEESVKKDIDNHNRMIEETKLN